MTGEAVSTRLMNVLQAAHHDGRLTFLGGDGYTVRIEVTRLEMRASVVRSGSTEQMWAWHNGFTRGAQLPGEDGWWWSGDLETRAARLARARADTAAFRKLVLDPSLADAIRVQILAGMEQRGLNFKELATLIGKGDQTVRDALLFGGPNPKIGNVALFDLMLRSLELPVRIHRDPIGDVAGVDLVDAVAGPRVEPSGVTRMRALVIAVERQLVDAVAPSGLQRARRTRDFTVSVAGHELVRPRETLVHWLRGLADGAGDPLAMVALNLT